MESSFSGIAIIILLLFFGVTGLLMVDSSNDEAERLAQLEVRVNALESTSRWNFPPEKLRTDQFEEERLRNDVTNLQVHLYGFAKGKGTMVCASPEQANVPLEGWEIYFRLWNEDDREHVRAHLVARTAGDGSFEISLPPGTYDEIQFGGGNHPAGFTFSGEGYPVRNVTIRKDQTVELPPIELIRETRPDGVHHP